MQLSFHLTWQTWLALPIICFHKFVAFSQNLPSPSDSYPNNTLFTKNIGRYPILQIVSGNVYYEGKKYRGLERRGGSILTIGMGESDFIELRCDASYPVQWVVNVFGVPGLDLVENDQSNLAADSLNKLVDVRRESGSFLMRKYFSFDSAGQIVEETFRKTLRMRFHSAGMIRCQSALKPSRYTALYSFFQRLPPASARTNMRSFVLNQEYIREEGENIVFPCRTNLPDPPEIKLQVVINDTHGEDVAVPSGSLSWDPKVGFTIWRGNFSGTTDQFYRCMVPSNSESMHIAPVDILVGLTHISATDGTNLMCGIDANASAQLIIKFDGQTHVDCRPITECALSNGSVSSAPDGFMHRDAPLGSRWRKEYSFGIFVCQWSYRRFGNDPAALENFSLVRRHRISSRYFKGLDKKFYLYPSSFPTSAVMEMGTTPESNGLYYVNETYEFTCKVVCFVLHPASVVLGVRYTSNEVRPLARYVYDIGSIMELKNCPRTNIYELCTSLRLEKNMTEVVCLARKQDDFGWFNTSVRLHVQDPGMPHIHDRERIKVFNVGSSVNVSCTSDHASSFHWVIPKNAASKVRTEDDGTLTIDNVDDSVEGVYVCIASGFYGNDSMEYFFQMAEAETDCCGNGIVTWCAIALTVLALVLVGGFMWKRCCIRKEQPWLSPTELRKFLVGDVELARTAGDAVEKALSRPFQHQILPENIPSDLKVLHSGKFGKTAEGLFNGNRVTFNVTKALANTEDLTATIQNLKLMSYVGQHKHIVGFYGAVINALEQGGDLITVREWSPFGPLPAHLVKMQQELFTPVVGQEHKQGYKQKCGDGVVADPILTKLLAWCSQVASGMEHLESKGVVCGQLRAKNIYLFHQNVVKIKYFSHFNLHDPTIQVERTWRWSAYESLQNLKLKLSTLTDIWAFGVTAWEILSLGLTPYEDVACRMELEGKLKKGEHLPKPTVAPDNIYDMLVKCWNLNPSGRPAFSEIRRFFDDQAAVVTDVEHDESEILVAESLQSHGSPPNYVP